MTSAPPPTQGNLLLKWHPMRVRLGVFPGVLGVFVVLLLLHYPLLWLPYFWDEAGYYIPAALDFYRRGLLIPQSTLPTGHTPLVMLYLGLVWRVFGFSPLVTRAAMILVAAATVVTVYALGRRVAWGEESREIALSSALLLVLSPLFFAQSSLAQLDLPAALFTTLAVLVLLRRQIVMFALAASLAVFTKETAVVLLPAAWAFAWRARRELGTTAWIALAAPLLPLLAWSVYYHHSTGYWTGNREYLEYNLYSTLSPIRFPLSLLRRLYEVLIGGFNWLLVAGGILGIWRGRRRQRNRARGGFMPPSSIGRINSPRRVSPSATGDPPLQAYGGGTNHTVERSQEQPNLLRDFLFLAGALGTAYVLMLSLVGGAILLRYLLPILPLFFLVAVIFVWRLPRALALGTCLAVAGCFVGAWFLNPPYPFAFEDNVAYTDFVRLHQQAAQFLEGRPGQPLILTAWPASDELMQPFLGYVSKPLRVVSIRGFTAADFGEEPPESFDLLYLYSRKWEPANNWLMRLAKLREFQEHYFDYAPQIRQELLVARYGLKLLEHFKRRGQWVRIYSK